MNKGLRIKRHKKIRKHLRGTTETPRLAVFRSNQHIYAQIIDDAKGLTLAFVSDLKVVKKNSKAEQAYEVGKTLAQKAVALGVKKVVFDRGGFLYHGRIAKLAEGARNGGLSF
ncbi:MAG: 50S ribosomal protein L18 [Candidatus Daviesbacteria bacterium]|nr:50S ribosomal protein L18 [Candidatus Daviesbacteria bacterium]